MTKPFGKTATKLYHNSMTSTAPQIAHIVFPMPLKDGFDYLIPENMELAAGDFVIAPFGKTSKQGVVWKIHNNPPQKFTLKEVISKSSVAPLASDVLKFTDWAAKYLVTYRGSILGHILRPHEAQSEGPFIKKVIKGDAIAKLTAMQKTIWNLVSENNYIPQTRAELSATSGISTGVITGLIKKNALKEISQNADEDFQEPQAKPATTTLNPAQNAAKDEIVAAVQSRAFSPFLLDGVTGSGKTEVYLEAIAETLEHDKDAQILIMLPEIALTQAIIARISERFGIVPAQWHYEQTAVQKRRIWRKINSGNAKIIIGARSAVFLPFKNLRLIVIDEEHDTSYKQEDGLRYNGRDMAIVRAKLAAATIVMASATPSLETRNNALTGKYRRLVLANRFGSAVLPNIELVNLKEYPPPKDHWISPLLREEMANTLHRNEQVLLFLNRRGFAPVVLCSKCGHKMLSPDSDSWLVEHRFNNTLVCHLTGYTIPKPDNCPECHGFQTLVSIGPGVERIAEESRELFPKKVVQVLSSDTASTPQKLRELVEKMENREIDILIGTQITAKGHNFPYLTLVGVVDGDLGLKGGDPRATERTYQILTQVAGRAGRSDLKGKAIIQTYYPENEAFQALLNHDRDGFLSIETEMRAASGFPPFGRLAALQIMAKTDELIDSACETVSNALIAAEGVEVWGPAPPPIALVRGWRRRRYLVRAERNVDLSSFMLAWRKRIKLPPSIRIIIDIEPYSFM